MEIKESLKGLFLHKSNNIFLQLFRYTFVGGFAFVVDFGLLYILTEYAHLHYLLSATISFLVGLIVNYIISVIWVFSKSVYSNKAVEFLLFTGVGVIGLGINNVCLWLLSDVFMVWYMYSKVLTTVITYLWNFFARKFILFNKR